MVEKELIAKLREKYIQNPPEGMSAEEIREMDDEDLLDMDYFMHEDDEFFGIIKLFEGLPSVLRV